MKRKARIDQLKQMKRALIDLQNQWHRSDEQFNRVRLLLRKLSTLIHEEEQRYYEDLAENHEARRNGKEH